MAALECSLRGKNVDSRYWDSTRYSRSLADDVWHFAETLEEGKSFHIAGGSRWANIWLCPARHSREIFNL